MPELAGGEARPPQGRPWVCLMYHDVTVGGRHGGGGPERFAVRIEEFRQQLDQLASEGRAGRSLREALLPGAEQVVAITFDDGTAGQYERGFRALTERGMTATMFETTDWIGRPGFETWDQLREKRSAGMDVQSHGRSHRFLSELNPPELDAELQGSKDALDAGLGQDTDTLALPGGDWPRSTLRSRIGAAGYRVVATSRWGLNERPSAAGSVVAVDRCTVRGRLEPDRFRRIAGGDAWLLRQQQVRQGTLRAVRSALGPSRYASWRRSLLDRVAF